MFLYCIVLYCIVLYCIVLYCIVLHCIVLYCIVLLYCTVLYCIVLYCTVSYCAVLCGMLWYAIVCYGFSLLFYSLCTVPRTSFSTHVCVATERHTGKSRATRQFNLVLVLHNSDRAEIHWLKSFTDEGGEESGLRSENHR